MTDNLKEREAFEDHRKNLGFFPIRDGHSYKSSHDIDAWEAWVARAAIAQAQSCVPAGYVLVPAEPNIDMEISMIEASLLGRSSIDDPAYVRNIYAAALSLAASPQPQPKD